MRLVDEELRDLLGRHADSTVPLSPTTLVHEAYRGLTRGHDVPWSKRRLLFLVAAHAVRRMQVDAARRAVARGGGSASGDRGHDALLGHDPREVLALDRAMAALDRFDPVAAEIAHLRHFAGVGLGRIARALRVRTLEVERRWSFAKAFLRGEMERIRRTEEGRHGGR